MSVENKNGTGDVFSAFNHLSSFARDLNTQLQVPEIVFYGRKGHGKSTLIEALLGHPFNHTEKGGSTKRPFHINVLNNSANEQPKVTIKRDTVLKQFNNDQTVSLEKVSSELQQRNVISPTPVHVNYEVKNCWNVTYIDTPGLVQPGEKVNGDITADELEGMIVELAKPAHRILVCVEEVKEGNQSELLSFAKRLDPKLDRTIFVFTKFSEQLKGFTSAREVNRYLSSVSSSDGQSYFVSLISSEEKAKYPTKDSYKARLAQLVKDDLDNLEQLQYDRRYLNLIGVVAFRKHVLELTWQKYQASIPELLKRLRSFKKKSEDNAKVLETQIKNMDSNKLRGNAARFVMQFLQSIEKLLTGTLEGNPIVNGQTLEEEKNQDDAGDWLTYEYSKVQFDPVKWNIPHAGSKLYGGQQFERLLAEFKAVVEHTHIEQLTMDEIATAAGPQKLNTGSNATWAASDIVQRQIHKALVPLVDQLFKRAIYIMKRLVDVVDNMIESNHKNKKRTGRDDANMQELEQYPFFTHAVKDLYFKFVDNAAEQCKRKCKDEFLSTRIIYWEVTNLDGKTLTFKPTDSREEVRKAVTKLAEDLFIKIRDRIAKNIMLKAYNFFLVPMQTDLWGEIQGNITCLSDDELRELFEVDASLARLQDSEKDMKLILGKFSQQEDLLKRYANEFSIGNPRDLDL